MRAWVVWLAVAFAAMTGFWMLKGHFSGTDRSARYEAATACADGRPAPNCRSKETTKVTDKTEERSGRSGRIYTLKFQALEGNPSASVTAAQYEAVAVGDALDIERWDGRVTRIYRSGKPEAIVQTPKRRSPMLAMGIASLVVAMGLLWVGLKARRKQKHAKASHLA